MVSPTLPAQSCQPSSFLRDREHYTPETLDAQADADRHAPLKGAVTGILLGAGFWTALLVVILKH